ncbi:unnamed protein product [Calypogeia fissa]
MGPRSSRLYQNCGSLLCPRSTLKRPIKYYEVQRSTSSMENISLLSLAQILHPVTRNPTRDANVGLDGPMPELQP